MAVISNPGFETGTGQAATDWTYSETGSFDYGSGRSRRIEYSTHTPSNPTGDWTQMDQGTYGFVLGDSANGGLSSIPAGQYCQILQNFNFDRMNHIKVDYFMDGFGPWDGYRFDILVDTDVLHSRTLTSADVLSLEQNLDTSSYTGTHDFIFRLTSLTGTSGAAYGVYLDNIQEFLTPDSPVLVTPTNGDDDTNTPVSFDWDASADATTYDIQVATDSGFSNLVVNVTGLSTTSYDATGLEVGTLYYWRVRGVNSVGNGPWATAFSFTTFNASAPTLQSPANGAVEQRIGSTSFNWTDATEASDYRLQISKFSDFRSFVFNSLIGSSTSAYSYTDDLELGVTYYWRVATTARSLVSAWSSTFSFTTAYGTSCIIIPYFPQLAANHPIGILMNDGSTHWTLITGVSQLNATEMSVCFLTPLISSTSIGNEVYLPSLNRERWQ